MHVLNPAAVAVWQRLDGCLTLEEVVAGLGEEFDGMGSESGEQVLALARSLADLGAVGFLHRGSFDMPVSDAHPAQPRPRNHQPLQRRAVTATT